MLTADCQPSIYPRPYCYFFMRRRLRRNAKKAAERLRPAASCSTVGTLGGHTMTSSNGSRECLSLSGGCRRSPNLECPPSLLCLTKPRRRGHPRCSVHIISSAPNRGRQAKDDERQRTVTYASRGYGCAVERVEDRPHLPQRDRRMG